MTILLLRQSYEYYLVQFLSLYKTASLQLKEKHFLTTLHFIIYTMLQNAMYFILVPVL